MGNGLAVLTLADALVTVATWQRAAQASDLGNASALLPPTVLLFNHSSNTQPYVLERHASSGEQGGALQLTGPLLITGPVQQQPSEALQAMHNGSWLPYQGMPVVNASHSMSPAQEVELVQGPLIVRQVLLVDLPAHTLFGQGSIGAAQAGGQTVNASRLSGVPLVTLQNSADGGARNTSSSSASSNSSSSSSSNSSAPWVILDKVAIELGAEDFGPALALALLPKNTTPGAVVAAAEAARLSDLVKKAAPSSSSLSAPSAALLGALQHLVRALQQPSVSQLSSLELAYLTQGPGASSAPQHAPSICTQAGRECVRVARLEAASWTGTDLVLASTQPAHGELAWWHGQNLTALTELAGQMLRGELQSAGGSQGAGSGGTSGGAQKKVALHIGLGVGLGLGALLLLLLGITLVQKRRTAAREAQYKGKPASYEQGQSHAQGCGRGKAADVEAQEAPQAQGQQGEPGGTQAAKPREQKQVAQRQQQQQQQAQQQGQAQPGAAARDGSNGSSDTTAKENSLHLPEHLKQVGLTHVFLWRAGNKHGRPVWVPGCLPSSLCA